MSWVLWLFLPLRDCFHPSLIGMRWELVSEEMSDLCFIHIKNLGEDVVRHYRKWQIWCACFSSNLFIDLF